MKPVAAVFTTRFLPYSETFVHDELLAHGRNDGRYDAHVFCTRRAFPDRFAYPHVFEGGRLYAATRTSAAFDGQLARGHYSLIHAHFGTGGVYALPFARRHDLPLVVTFHGFDVPLLGSAERLYPKYWPYAVLGPAVLRHMTLGLCASVELRELLRELGVAADRLRLHHIGIDVSRFVPAARGKDSDDGDPVIVMIGRFVAKKGLVYGIRAFADVRRSRGRGRLIIVGDGELRASLRAAVREAEMDAHVTFAGALPHAEVAALLARADVLLAPSVTTINGDRESGTIAIKEASAAGAVPVATWHGGIPEIVDDGHTGFLVPERDVAALARRLEALLDDPALRARMRAAGRAKMLAQYDLGLRNRALEEAYDHARDRHALSRRA